MKTLFEMLFRRADKTAAKVESKEDNKSYSLDLLDITHFVNSKIRKLESRDLYNFLRGAEEQTVEISWL